MVNRQHLGFLCFGIENRDWCGRPALEFELLLLEWNYILFTGKNLNLNALVENKTRQTKFKRWLVNI